MTRRPLAPDERLANLAPHLTFIEQTEEDIARFKVRLEHVDDPRLRRMALADITRLKARRAAEMARVAKALRDHEDLGGRLDLVLSVPGIGQRTALSIVIRMPELGRISREEVAALAGLAPFDHDSGRHHGPAAHRRRTWTPSSLALRRRPAGCLPMEPQLSDTSIARLIATGKPHNLALTACARKLLIYANTVVQRGTPWVEVPSLRPNGCYGFPP